MEEGTLPSGKTSGMHPAIKHSVSVVLANVRSTHRNATGVVQMFWIRAALTVQAS